LLAWEDQRHVLAEQTAELVDSGIVDRADVDAADFNAAVPCKPSGFESLSHGSADLLGPPQNARDNRLCTASDHTVKQT
jgi:hypothetical protein